MNRDNYLSPKCVPENLDSFLIRDGIQKALQEALPFFSGTLLDIGCGFKPYRPLVLSPVCKVTSYVGLDFQDSIYGVPDLAWDGQVIPLADNSVESAMATEVLEHCPDPSDILAEILRVLKPGGVLFFTVPFLWPLHELPHDYYRYTPRALEGLLGKSGFAEIQISSLGGWDASLAQLLGLWASRRPMPKPIRSVLRFLVWPFYAALLHIDKKPAEFMSNSIFPGLSGLAKKPSSDE